jgi:hypothetical protein
MLEINTGEKRANERTQAHKSREASSLHAAGVVVASKKKSKHNEFGFAFGASWLCHVAAFSGRITDLRAPFLTALLGEKHT